MSYFQERFIDKVKGYFNQGPPIYVLGAGHCCFNSNLFLKTLICPCPQEPYVLIVEFKEADGLFTSYHSVFTHPVCQEFNSNLPVFFSQRVYTPNIVFIIKNQGIVSHHLNTILNDIFKIKGKNP